MIRAQSLSAVLVALGVICGGIESEDLSGRWAPVRPVTRDAPVGTTPSGLATSLDGALEIVEDAATITLDYGFLKIAVGPDSALHPPDRVLSRQLPDDNLRSQLALPAGTRGRAQVFWGRAHLTTAPDEPSRLTISIEVSAAPRAAVLWLTCYRRGEQLVIERRVEQPADRTIVMAPVTYRKS